VQYIGGDRSESLLREMNRDMHARRIDQTAYCRIALSNMAHAAKTAGIPVYAQPGNHDPFEFQFFGNACNSHYDGFHSLIQPLLLDMGDHTLVFVPGSAYGPGPYRVADRTPGAYPNTLPDGTMNQELVVNPLQLVDAIKGVKNPILISHDPSHIEGYDSADKAHVTNPIIPVQTNLGLLTTGTVMPVEELAGARSKNGQLSLGSALGKKREAAIPDADALEHLIATGQQSALERMLRAHTTDSLDDATSTAQTDAAYDDLCRIMDAVEHGKSVGGSQAGADYVPTRLLKTGNMTLTGLLEEMPMSAIFGHNHEHAGKVTDTLGNAVNGWGKNLRVMASYLDGLVAGLLEVDGEMVRYVPVHLYEASAAVEHAQTTADL